MTIKINIKGGILSPSWLQSVLEIAKKAAVENISFGARQQLLMDVHEREMDFFKRKISELGIEIEENSDTLPNILSSYAFEGIFNTEGWLGEGIYQDILAGFNYKPTLKINICDKDQSHAPFFTGHLNFISSDVPHYWFCFIRLPKTNRIERYDKLIYSLDIPLFAKKIEAQITQSSTLNPQSLQNTEGVIMRPIDTDLVIPRFVMPYYEGVNLWGNTPWIGIYRRDEKFPIKLMLELCELCKETKVGNLCVTAWRSLIIKGVQGKDRLAWEKLLSKHNINVRHAALELNWQTEDDSPKGFKLKQFLVKRFNDLDLRTFGLLFAIKTRHKSEVFGSVIIRREPFFKIGNWGFDLFGTLGTYDIFYAEDFNPHTRKRKTHQLGVPKWRLTEELFQLSQKYFAQLTGDKEKQGLRVRVKTDAPEKKATLHIPSKKHQCPCCWTIFDDNTEGVKFEDLSPTFECPTCGEEKSSFVLMDEGVGVR
jgi:rubredoxin